MIKAYGVARKTSQGFTLLELIIAICVVGILVAMIYPAYRAKVRESNRVEGRALLSEAAIHQEQYFNNNASFTTDMTALGYASDPALSSNGFYTLDAATGSSGSIADSFRLTVQVAGLQVDDNECVAMSVDNLQQKFAMDVSSGTATATCW